MSRFGFTQNVHYVKKLELHAETGSTWVTSRHWDGTVHREVRFRGHIHDGQLGASGTVRKAVRKNRTYTKRMRILDLPPLPLWKRNESRREISMAESVVVTCCAAPDKNMARTTEVMESKKCRRDSKIEEREAHSIDRMVDIGKRLGLGKVRHGPEQTKTFFFTSVGRMHPEVRHGYKKQRSPQEQDVYICGERREENTVRSGTEYTRGVSLAGDGLRRSRSSKNTKTGCQQVQRKTRDGWPQHRTENDGREKSKDFLADCEKAR